MRAFVVGTGRCGTCTMYHALSHCTNYTVGHESRAGRVEDHQYPDNHIEVSAHLAIAIPVLQERYPRARWIHLIRDREAFIRSAIEESPGGLLRFAGLWFQCNCNKIRKDKGEGQGDILQPAAELYYDYINALCKRLLQFRLTVHLEQIKDEWLGVWDWLGLEGDFDASLKEWDRAYNPAVNRGRDNYVDLRSR